MTLDTKVIVVDPVPVEALWLHVVDLLGRAVDFEPAWDHAPPPGGWRCGRCRTALGQGLPALTDLTHAVDGPLHFFDDDEAAWRASEDPAWTRPWWDQHCATLSFDTGYGWVHPRTGGRPRDLHAWLVAEVGAWLAERGVDRWVWLDESAGEWRSPSEIARLGDVAMGRFV